MTVWEDFIQTVTLENQLLLELIAISKKKQTQINDAQEVACLAGQEQILLDRLEKVDRSRASLFDVVAPGQKLEQWLIALDDEQQEAIGPLILDLAQNLGTLQTLNELNQELLAQSLSYVQFSLNLLIGDDTSPIYPRPGGSTPGKSIFDRKV